MNVLRKLTIWRLALALTTVTAIALAIYYRGKFDVHAIERWMAAAGVWAPLAFIALYAVAAVLFLPGSALTLAGGALFGPMWGVVYSLSGATIGAALAFLIARYMASGWVEGKIGGKLKKLYDGVEEEGWRFVAFTRLVPLFPFNLLNYALGLTRIRFSSYTLATFVFMAPGGIAYTYLGYAGKEALAGGEGLVQKGLMALGLLAVALFLPRFVMKMRKEKRVDMTDQSKVPGADYSAANFTPKEKGKIAKSVNGKYRKVAESPEGLFKYPTGRAGLDALKYDPELVRLLPDSVAESYCGPGNPFSIGAVTKGDSVLDIGCGAGVDTILAGMMAEPEGYATGLEIVPEMLERARRNLRELGIDNVTVIEASAEQIPLPGDSFDVVISNGVFNLVVDKVKALKEVFRVLKPGGRFHISDQIRTGEMPKETGVIVKSWGR